MAVGNSGRMLRRASAPTRFPYPNAAVTFCSSRFIHSQHDKANETSGMQMLKACARHHRMSNATVFILQYAVLVSPDIHYVTTFGMFSFACRACIVAHEKVLASRLFAPAAGEGKTARRHARLRQGKASAAPGVSARRLPRLRTGFASRTRAGAHDCDTEGTRADTAIRKQDTRRHEDSRIRK